jgi:hypothetical protein
MPYTTALNAGMPIQLPKTKKHPHAFGAYEYFFGGNRGSCWELHSLRFHYPRL